MKYPIAISPDVIKAAQRVNRPMTISPPANHLDDSLKPGLRQKGWETCTSREPEQLDQAMLHKQKPHHDAQDAEYVGLKSVDRFHTLLSCSWRITHRHQPHTNT